MLLCSAAEYLSGGSHAVYLPEAVLSQRSHPELQCKSTVNQCQADCIAHDYRLSLDIRQTSSVLELR